MVVVGNMLIDTDCGSRINLLAGGSILLDFLSPFGTPRFKSMNLPAYTEDPHRPLPTYEYELVSKASLQIQWKPDQGQLPKMVSLGGFIANVGNSGERYEPLESTLFRLDTSITNRIWREQTRGPQ
jgi:hypothetical protein